MGEAARFSHTHTHTLKTHFFFLTLSGPNLKLYQVLIQIIYLPLYFNKYSTIVCQILNVNLIKPKLEIKLSFEQILNLFLTLNVRRLAGEG